MTNFVEKAADVFAEPGRLTRRRLIGRLAKLSAATAAVAAGAAEFTGNAYAGNYLCCNLAWPNNFCNSDYWTNNSCPSGCGTAYVWTCKSGNCTVYCGECYDCSCSFGYFVPCSPGCACSPQLAEFAKTMTVSPDLAALYPHRAPGERCH